MVSFWNSITSTIGSIAHEAYGDISNAFQSANKTVDDIAKDGFSTVNNAVDKVSGLGVNAENKIGSAVTGAESVISLPLILIAGGLAFFLLSKNAGTAIEVGGRIAEKKL